MKNSFIGLKFSKIAIDLNKVPENVKFHWDVNSLPFGVFTETDIPAEAVSFVEKVL